MRSTDKQIIIEIVELWGNLAFLNDMMRSPMTLKRTRKRGKVEKSAYLNHRHDGYCVVFSLTWHLK